MLLHLPPIHAHVDRIERITVCTRPFRAEGPRIEAETIGTKRVVHNYGHGGAGWSLSWGSAARVVALVAPQAGEKVAVVGCGALGLSAAIALQRAGARVTIYARERPPDVRSSRATGTWTPDARVALARSVDAGFAERWEAMARESFREYMGLLDTADAPITLHHRYVLSDVEPEAALRQKHTDDPIGFVHLEDRLADLYPSPVDYGPELHPFPTAYARRLSLFRFNIAAYSKHLLREFEAGGGRVEAREFGTAAEFVTLPEPVVVNCTGYGARALLGDDSVIPVRGQITWLPAQPEVDYGVQWDNLNIVSRPDGMVVQFGAGGDGSGWMDDSEVPDRAEAEAAVGRLIALQAGMQR